MRTRAVAAVAAAAALGLAGCTSGGASHAAGPRTSPATTRSSHAPIVPVSCSTQYRSWARGDGKGLMTALDAVAAGAGRTDGRVLHHALAQAGPAVARAAAHPIPACADPRGYWDVLLMHVNAAVSGKNSTAGLRAALRDVPKIHQQLVTEVKNIS